MRPNPALLLEKITTPIGRIVALPFVFIASILKRLYANLQAHPQRYVIASRILASGILASLGIFIAVTIVGNIALLQSLKMLAPEPHWQLWEAAVFIVFCALVGGLIGFGMTKMQPNLLRGLLGGLSAFALTAAVVMVLRYGFGYTPWDGAGGTIAMLTAFPVAFATVWGMGGFARQNLTIEANIEARKVTPTPEPNLGAFDGVKFNVRLLSFLNNRIWPVIKPLVGPAALVSVMVGSVIAILLIIAQFAPGKRTQTYNIAAEATTIAGQVEFAGLMLPKFLVFLIVAALILGAVATTALLLALLFNALGSAVLSAKKAQKTPFDPSQKGRSDPLSKAFQWVMRLVKFTIDFGVDMFNAVAGAISRPSR